MSQIANCSLQMRFVRLYLIYAICTSTLAVQQSLMVFLCDLNSSVFFSGYGVWVT